jgi:hypothetical protein
MYDIYASYTSTCHNHLFSTHEAPGARRLRTALSPTLSLPNTPGPMDCPHSLTHSLSLSSCARRPPPAQRRLRNAACATPATGAVDPDRHMSPLRDSATGAVDPDRHMSPLRDSATCHAVSRQHSAPRDTTGVGVSTLCKAGAPRVGFLFLSLLLRESHDTGQPRLHPRARVGTRCLLCGPPAPGRLEQCAQRHFQRQ